jgi:ABC-2 type transport system permease protein
MVDSLHRLRHAVFLYRRSLGAVMRSILEYPADFWILIVAGLITETLGLAFIGIVMARVPHINGWSFPEMVLIYGLTGLSAAIVPTVADGIWQLSWRIHSGQLDYMITRPSAPLLQMMSSWVGFNGIGDLFAGAALVGWALTRVDIAWSPGMVAASLVLLLSTMAIRLAIAVAANSVSFWLKMPAPFFAMSVWQVGDLARYPLGIYSLPMRVLLGAAIPFAFAGFFPAAWLLGRGGYAWLGALSPLVAVAAWVAAVWIFRRGLRSYESAGN